MPSGTCVVSQAKVACRVLPPGAAAGAGPPGRGGATTAPGGGPFCRNRSTIACARWKFSSRSIGDRVQVTLIACDGFTSDPLSTAFGVLGPEESRKLLRAYPRATAYLRVLPAEQAPGDPEMGLGAGRMVE
jgi:hypothetical protein